MNVYLISEPNLSCVACAMDRKKCWFVDSKGLLSSARTDTLDAHKVPFAHDISIVAGSIDMWMDVFIYVCMYMRMYVCVNVYDRYWFRRCFYPDPAGVHQAAAAHCAHRSVRSRYRCADLTYLYIPSLAAVSAVPISVSIRILVYV